MAEKIYVIDDTKQSSVSTYSSNKIEEKMAGAGNSPFEPGTQPCSAQLKGDDSDSDLMGGRATGLKSLALGNAAFASGESSVVIGEGSWAEKHHSIAIGPGVHSSGNTSIAIGGGTTVEGASSIGMGPVYVSGNSSVAIGHGASVTGNSAYAIGSGAQAPGSSSLSMGHGSQAVGVNTVAIGSGNRASGRDSYSIGSSGEVSGANSYSFGEENTVTGDRSIAVGNNNTLGQKSGVLGLGNRVNDESFVIGIGNQADTYSYVLGHDSTAKFSSYVIGPNSTAESNSYAIGQGNTAKGGTSFALGLSNLSDGGVNFTIGGNNIAIGNSGTAIGSSNVLLDNADIAIGFSNEITYPQSIAIGTSNVASNSYALATGNGTEAYGQYSTTMGSSTYALGTAATAEGQGDKTTNPNYKFIELLCKDKDIWNNVYAIGGIHITAESSCKLKIAYLVEEHAVAAIAINPKSSMTTVKVYKDNIEDITYSSVGEYHGYIIYTFDSPISVANSCSYANLSAFNTALAYKKYNYNSGAYGYASHSEGYVTTARGNFSHSEGYYTIAAADMEHVSGKYNAPLENESNYACVVGNGVSEDFRRNAYTLDWNGNGWFAGDVTATAENGSIISMRELAAKSIPIASESTLGGIRVGNGLGISEAGILSVNSNINVSYSLNSTSTGGFWIDDKKILKKTLKIDNLTLGDITVAHGISSINTIVKKEITSAGTFGSIEVNVDKTNLYIRILESVPEYLYITLYYTTDFNFVKVPQSPLYLDKATYTDRQGTHAIAALANNIDEVFIRPGADYNHILIISLTQNQYIDYYHLEGGQALNPTSSGITPTDSSYTYNGHTIYYNYNYRFLWEYFDSALINNYKLPRATNTTAALQEFINTYFEN